MLRNILFSVLPANIYSIDVCFLWNFFRHCCRLFHFDLLNSHYLNWGETTNVIRIKMMFITKIIKKCKM